MNISKLRTLKELSNKARIYGLMSIFFAGSGHPGGVLSSIDIILYIYFRKIKINIVSDFKKINRDRFILSKGHSSPAIYAALAALKILNYKKILSLRKIDSIYQGHSCRTSTPWVEASTGSLGQGFSFAIGQALTLKYLKKNNNIFVMIGDGEMQEGQIWEGIMFAAQHKLKNLIAILDYNKLQSDDLNKNIINIMPVKQKLHSFNWNVIEINGHSFNQIEKALDKKFNNNKPIFIIANTVKGKGVSFMENKPLWHGSLKMSFKQISSALKELGSTNDLIDECKKNE